MRINSAGREKKNRSPIQLDVTCDLVTLPYRDILIAHNTVVGRWEAALYLTLLNDTNTANFVLLNNAFLTSNSTSASSINIALFPPGTLRCHFLLAAK